MLRATFLTLLTACATFAIAVSEISYNNVENRCTTPDCNYLYHDIVRHVNLSVNRCEDIHTFVCNNRSGINMDQHVMSEYISLRNRVQDILSSEITDQDDEALELEKVLYQECLKLSEHESETAKIEVQRKLVNIEDLLNKSENWQVIHRELYRFGFGYSLFDIKVVRDPERTEKNIIMVEPPAVSTLTQVFDMWRNLAETAILDEHSEGKTTSLYQYIKSKGIISITTFLNSLVQSVFESSAKNETSNKNIKTKIFNWHRTFNKGNGKEDPAYINWTGILVESFQNAGINIQYSEPLLIKNELYFALLSNILQQTQNDIIGVALITKVLTENLRYFDWHLANAIQPVDGFDFCMNETKLYAVTHKELQFMENNGKGIEFYNKLRKINSNIERSMRSQIYKAKSLSYKEESYLLAEINDIIIKAQSNIWKPDILSNCYEKYDLSYSYLNNILNYRKMINNKEFIRLNYNGHLTVKYSPISIIDLADPANRFALQMYFNGDAINNLMLPNQVQYGAYGVRMASLLYGLLNENKLIDFLFGDGSKLDAKPHYSMNMIKCMIPEFGIKDIKSSEIVSDAFGLKVAYDAMKGSTDSKLSLQDDLFPKEKLNNLDQFYYLVFVKLHCTLGQLEINRIVLKNQNFLKTFQQCPRKNVKCEVAPFEHMEQNTFLMKL